MIRILPTSYFLLMVSATALSYAGAPVWTLTPLTSTTISISSGSTATIQYQVTNQSRKKHTLSMTGITGISQDTSAGHCSNPFTLAYQQSCTLSLTVDGSALQGNIAAGPVLCDSGSHLQCYQPSTADALNISLSTGPGGTTLSSSATSATPLALSVNNTGLNPALTGTPRQIIITNTGSNPASNVTYSPSPALPTGTTISPSTCGTIAPAGQCILTITPGSTPSSAPYTLNPTPITLTISSTNANSVTSPFYVLTYANVWQDGYIYAIDDTSNTSLHGKVASLSDVAAPYIFYPAAGPQSTSTIWGSNGNGFVAANVSYDTIPFIAETPGVSDTYVDAQTHFNNNYIHNTYQFPSQSAFSTCTGSTDGKCNSGNTLAFYNSFNTNYGISSSPYTPSAGATSLSDYAAGLCYQYTAGGASHGDWYLPAICEMDAEHNPGPSTNCTAGTQSMVNSLTNLIGNSANPNPSTNCANGVNCLAGIYWSSTEYSQTAAGTAFKEEFYSPSSNPGVYNKNFQLGVRCSRAF